MILLLYLFRKGYRGYKATIFFMLSHDKRHDTE